MDPHDSEQTLDLEQIIAILRRRAPIIVLCLVLVAGSAFVFSKHQTKKYTATSSLVFNNAQISQQVAGLQAAGGSEPKVQHGRTCQGFPPEQEKKNLSTSAEGESNVVDVAPPWPSPAVATKIANTYANQFVSD